MILVKIIILIAVYFAGPKLMNLVDERRKKVNSLSLASVILTFLSVFLASSFMTFFIVFPLQFFSLEYVEKHYLSLFAVLFAAMIGVKLTDENAPNFPHYMKVLTFLFIGGLVFWPSIYFFGKSLEVNINSVTFFSYSGVIEFSAWMIGMTLLSPTLVELTERYI